MGVHNDSEFNAAFNADMARDELHTLELMLTFYEQIDHAVLSSLLSRLADILRLHMRGRARLETEDLALLLRLTKALCDKVAVEDDREIFASGVETLPAQIRLAPEEQ